LKRDRGKKETTERKKKGEGEQSRGLKERKKIKD